MNQQVHGYGDQLKMLIFVSPWKPTLLESMTTMAQDCGHMRIWVKVTIMMMMEIHIASMFGMPMMKRIEDVGSPCSGTQHQG